MTTFCGLYIAMTDQTGFDRSNWILIYHFGRLCILPYPLHCGMTAFFLLMFNFFEKNNTQIVINNLNPDSQDKSWQKC